ncbi:MAG: ACT domain-containing protein [Acidobacteria bacterium]|nr:ACT domain-containing protein [Acidobacteriota bacterium]MCI0622563.1 ACT domain-containing protein [Acidobacteriota bacterium]
MPRTKELNLRMEDRPGTLGKISQALADRGVNILAFQSFPSEGKSLVRLVVDNLATAKTVLDSQGISYNESDIAQTSLPNRPGELARAASRLGDAKININYGYSGIDPGTNKPLLLLGVTDISRAVEILDQAEATAARG